MAESYKHIFITGNVNREKYKTPSSRGGQSRIPVRDRVSQSQKLLKQFDAIWQAKALMQKQREAEQIATREGTYISFTSAADHDLITKSLEDLGKGIRLLNIKEIPVGENHTQIRATVYVPIGKEGLFISKINSYRTKNITTITFLNEVDHDAVAGVINQLGNNIRLKKIKDVIINNVNRTKASINLPVEQEDFFRSEIQRLFPNTEIKITPSNADLVNSIEDVSVALLEGLWTDNLQMIPTENTKWCEVWLNVNTKENLEQKQIAQFLTTLETIGIEVKHNSIIFPERAVLLINANRQSLIELMLQSDLLAEFRAGQEPAGFWVNESSKEQQNWVENLLQRIELVDSNVKVCLLDSGVNNGHQLLQPLIDDANTLTVDNAWGTNDHSPLRGGHGTLMAGIAGYGKLEEALISGNIISLTHRLCSVKILPRPNQEETPKELWGDVTAQGIARAEIQNPNMVLVYCMSVTSTEDSDKGRPSSWSGAMDNLAFGEGENQRLIIISAGNISNEESWRNYPDSNFTSSVQNPAQSWNAIVAGAYTEKTKVYDDNYREYTPVSDEGELSPYSSTSLVWEKKWPIKPDVVFEGGNLLKAPDDIVTPHEDLELLSTSKSFNIKPFDTINATSAAAAQASWFAAKIAFEYPDAWAETIRGLMVHSAHWNHAMFNQMNVQPGNRTSFRNLLKVFGFGIPQIDRALYSQESALTFIAQENIQPFNYKAGSSSQAETNEIHFFNLPWPGDLLLGMDQIPVKLRITLSYFIEPGAGEIGWKDKYRYQSHGLRFDINNSDETEELFRKRINIAAREENEEISTYSGSSRWVIGKDNRSNGSIHSDFIELTAAELATCNHIAVYPVIGWWRERKHLGKVENRTRYSLIISLDTPAQDVPLYTAVKNLIEIPIEIRTT
ncbi:MAG: S8 family peptidase [Candidatus Bathyarchaeota archaeon]|nr:S8 family peptidase [Candidatus Bathyarchaeota archaeon]